jgi:NAD-dependent dihydropyrimidine dehydrogenase PreA subunit
MQIKRKVIQIDEGKCDGCGVCVPSCAEGALQVINGKARLIAEKYCDGLGACLKECPRDALKVIETTADDFDEAAVEEHLKASGAGSSHSEKTPESMPCGCPSANIRSFAPAGICEQANQPATQSSAASSLTHWPIQIRLVPPSAPFLKGADLLVAADCTPVAYPDFQRDFLRGKAVMIGCPKFDEAQAYVKKFADIFMTAGIASVTVLTMEVPCCQGLPVIVMKGMEMAGKNVPLTQVIISTKGEILAVEKLVAWT